MEMREQDKFTGVCAFTEIELKRALVVTRQRPVPVVLFIKLTKTLAGTYVGTVIYFYGVFSIKIQINDIVWKCVCVHIIKSSILQHFLIFDAKKRIIIQNHCQLFHWRRDCNCKNHSAFRMSEVKEACWCWSALNLFRPCVIIIVHSLV